MDRDNKLIDTDYDVVNERCSCDHDHHKPHTEPPVSCGSVSSVTEPTCASTPAMPAVIPSGNIVAKIPILLTELKIQIPVIADITLQNPAIEIKRIRKNVYLTQCKVLPQFTDGFVSSSGLLFLEGFVRKNIEYATKACNADGVISGNIQHTTAQVPFSCITPVTFARLPVLTRNSATLELELFEDTLRSCDPCAEPVIGREPCEQDFFNSEIFNEKIFCELVKTDITEADFHKNVTPLSRQQFCDNPTEQVFTQIREKMIINLTLKVLQKQQVRVTSLGPVSPSSPTHDPR